MANESSANRYAKVLLEVAKEEKAIDSIGEALNTLKEAFKASPELYKTLLNPMYPTENRMAIVKEVAKKAQASDSLSNLLASLTESRKIRLIEQIAEAYSNLMDIDAGRLRVTVESAAKLGSDEEKALTEKLKKETGKDIILTSRENKDLIGGIVVRVGNTILDGSFRKQLKNIKETLREGTV